MRKIMVGLRQSQLQRERVADSHAVFAVEHERHRARDVGIEGQRDQVEHVAIILGRLTLGRRVQIQVRVVLLLQRDVDPTLGGDQSRLHFIERGQVLIHPFPVRLAQLLIERTRAVDHRVHQLDAALQLLVLRFYRGAVSAKQAIENPARVVLRRNRPSFQTVGNCSRPREEAGARIDRQHQRRLPAVLLGVQRHHLIEARRVESPRLRVVQRCAGEPHVGANMRIRLRTARMVQPAHEAELLPKRAERLGRAAKHEFTVALNGGKPAPLRKSILRLRQ